MTDRMQEVEVSQPGPTFPREIVDGVHWLGGCLVPEVGGHKFHNHISAYLIKGDEKTLFFDTGHPAHWQAVERDLDVALGGRPLDYIVPSHSEMPHSGNLPRLLDKYPTSLVHGEVRDYHLYYPGCEDRLVPGRPGDELDLGGRRFRLLSAIIADLPSTLWGYDTGANVLFVSDGYAYSHEHEADQCALAAEELPSLPTPEQTRIINEKALYWTRFRDMAPYFDRFAALREELGAEVIAPAHGSVITDPEAALPLLESGYRS